MKKRLLPATISIIVAAVFCLQGCSKNVDTATSGELKKEFIVGEIFSDTGTDADYGKSIHNGAYMAVDEINENGGLNIGGENYTLRLISVDDESNSDKAKNAYNTLMDKGAQAILGTYSGESCKAVEYMADDDNILMIVPSSSDSDTAKSDNSFRISISDEKQGDEIAQYSFYRLNCKNAAVLYQESDTKLVEEFIKKFNDIGGEVKIKEIYNKDLQNISSALNRIDATNPDIIFVAADSLIAPKLLEQIDNKGIRSSVIGDYKWSGMTSIHYRNIIHAGYISPFGKGYQAFSGSYMSEYGQQADIYSAQGYDSVYAIKQALEEAGNIDSDLQICAMTDIKFDGVTGNGISFDESGDSSRDMEFIKLQ